MELGNFSLYPLRRNPQKPGSSHLEGEERQPRLMDSPTSCEHANNGQFKGPGCVRGWRSRGLPAASIRLFSGTVIRNKYEKKKYIAREWKPTPPPDLPIGWAEIIEAEKQKKDIRSVKLPSINAPPTTPEHAATTTASTNNLSKSPVVTNKSSPVPARQAPVSNQAV